MPEDEKDKSIFKASLKFAYSLLKGLLIPFSAGLLMWCISYPLNKYSCYSYADAIEKPYKFQWFRCYILADDGKYLEKAEYQAREIGMRLVIEPELNIKK